MALYSTLFCSISLDCKVAAFSPSVVMCLSFSRCIAGLCALCQAPDGVTKQNAPAVSVLQLRSFKRNRAHQPYMQWLCCRKY